MQNFAINGGSLNGDPEVWIADTSLSVVLQAAGEVMQGLTLAGSAPVAVATSLPLSFMAKLQGYAGISVIASGSLAYGVSLVGASPVHVQASGDLIRWGMIEGEASTIVDANGDIAVVPSISATFDLILAADLDLHVAAGPKIEGHANIVVEASFNAYSVPATLLTGFAIIQAAGIGSANLVITSPPGSAAITLVASADTRQGERIDLEGAASIEFYARGYSDSWHYVFAEANTSIEIAARAEFVAAPVIPVEYVPAPRLRTFTIPREARDRRVDRERRLF